MAAGGVVDGQLLGENDINTEPVEAKDATKEKDSKFLLYCCIMYVSSSYVAALCVTPPPLQKTT